MEEKKKRPKISVIMGVYNGADLLDEAIESVRAQSFQDWEFVICDDASTDNTWEKLVEWSHKDPRIIVIRNEKNLKLAATLNKCLEVSTGIYIARMDADDYSYPWRFKMENEFLDVNTTYAFVSGQVNALIGRKIVERYWERKAYPIKRDFLEGSQFIHPATMFRRGPLVKVGGYRVAPETTRLEDYDLFMRLYAAGYEGHNLHRSVLRYTVVNKPVPYKYRIDEAKVRYRGFKSLGLLPKGILHVFRPLLVGLFPQDVLWEMKTDDKRRKKKKKYDDWDSDFKF